MSKMSISIDKKLLYVRELTEAEAALIDSAVMATPMLMCPDHAKIKETGEEITVGHAFFAADGLHYGFDHADGKYSTLHSDKIELLNPKFDWNYIAKQNESRR